jgi:hypothetical protein
MDWRTIWPSFVLVSLGVLSISVFVLRLTSSLSDSESTVLLALLTFVFDLFIAFLHFHHYYT